MTTLHTAEANLAGHVQTSGARPLIWGVVTAVITGPPAKVTVTVDGGTATTNCRYLKGYTPAVNDVVGLIPDGRHLFCIGTPA